MTPEQRKNLAVLTLYVASLPPDYQHFDMAWFVSNGGHDASDAKARTFEPHCGTAACFAGHGPNAGIEPKTNETWGSYVVRCFGVDKLPWGLGGHFDWVFGAAWENDHKFAVKRASWLLQTGSHPEVEQKENPDTYEDYMEWDEPEGWDSFTPDMELITRIAKGEA